MKSILSIPLLDFRVYKNNLFEIPFGQKTLINTINQYSFCIAQKDAAFKRALLGSDILLADGMAIVSAVQLLHGKNIPKIAGADLHDYLLKELNGKNGSCFYLGASNATLDKIMTRQRKEFPNVQVGSFSPPFKPKFSTEENREMIAAVNTFKPDVLFIGMTAPKQEKWAFEHREEIVAPIICSIGAVFDFYAGTVERPSPFWVRFKLEWFIRLVKEPRRMSKRYLYYGPVFILAMLKEKGRVVFINHK
jgi:N-acetylglucosaminyldiphosphoundecaprenol N-acetyl-beta-D-mannosaminyltransferase